MVDYRSSCDRIVSDFVIERYTAGKLQDSETAAFEAHLLTCDRCQKEFVLAVAVRESLLEEEAEQEPAVPGRLPWRGVTAGLTLAAAAVVALILVPRDRVSEYVAELGRVTQPPVYLGVPVRQAPTRPDSVFAEAMSRYAVGDYDRALRGLDAALAAGSGPVPSEFFRGASLLMIDRPLDAAEAFRSVIAAGNSPYLAEAHFYLAKARLRLGESEAALASLDTSIETAQEASEIERAARALADSVETAMGGDPPMS